MSPKSAQTKVAPPPSSSKTSNKKDVVDKQKPAPSNVTPKKPTTTTVGALPSVNAWLKPLQETITEKAAAAAAARVSKPKPPINTVVVNSSSSAVATTAPTTATTSSSSQSWSVVVGSRSTTSGTSVTFSNGADIKGGVQVQPKEPNVSTSLSLYAVSPSEFILCNLIIFASLCFSAAILNRRFDFSFSNRLFRSVSSDHLPPQCNQTNIPFRFHLCHHMKNPN